MSEATRILQSIDSGDPNAAEELLPLVYNELRRLAASKMARENPGQTLQATALVHEVYIKLIGSENQEWKGSAHFFGAAAEAMRRILIDNARRKQRARHGGGKPKVDLDKVDVAMESDSDTLLLIHEALDALAKEDPLKAELVKLRFFVGMSVSEAGQMLGLSERTIHRHWTFTRAWLYEHIKLQLG